jgi:hypothetical protein
MWEVLNTSDLLDSAIRFVPGQKLPVRGLGSEIQAIGNQNIPDMSSNSIMQVVKGYVEEYQSSNDYLFRNPTNAGGGKTLGEVQAGMSQNSNPLNLEIIQWNEFWSRIYQKMFEVMKERMGDSMWVDGEEITKEDFNFPAEVKSNGELEVADQQLSTQKASMRLQVMMNPALGAFVTDEDRYNAYTDWLEKDGVKDPDRYSTAPMEVAQDKLMQLQQQILQMQQQVEAGQNGGDKKSPSMSIGYNDLPPEGQIQMAAQAGIQLDPRAVVQKQALGVAKEAKSIVAKPQQQGVVNGLQR